MFVCLECGRKFKTVKAAERAADRGCPGCGGVDIDLGPSDPPARPAARKPAWPDSDPVLKRFADDHGVDIDRVPVIVRLADECCRLNTMYCNGDPHPHNPDPTDKNRNAELWGNATDVAAAELGRYVERFGFRVEFNGLRPCLRDAAGRYIEIPHRRT